jgi:hypothetical protein
MTISPELCPLCKADGVIATVNGPTCKCAGFKWPEYWSGLTEAQRVEWVWKNRAAVNNAGTSRK